MSIELQIQSSILAAITARAVQARLRTTCFQPIGAVYIDHADVAAAPVELITANAAVRLRIPLDVFFVPRLAVLAAPNAVPTGATGPAKTVVVVLEMAATGAVVSLRCVGVEGAEDANDVICQAVGSLVNLNLAATLGGLGMPTPGSSRVDLIGGIVAIRFEPAGAPAAHLFPGHDWGMFLDGVSVEQLAMLKVPNNLRSRFSSLTMDPHWRPAGDKPHVDIDYAGQVALPDPFWFSADADGVIGFGFSLTPAPLPRLRTTVHWTLNVNISGVGIIDGWAEDYATRKIKNSFDVASIGGTKIDEHTFSIDSPLPDVSFGGARFGYASAVASPAGMTIGGAVRLPLDPGRDIVHPSASKFGPYLLITTCRNLAKSGSGEPPNVAALDEAKTYATVHLEGFGKFCGVECVSPGNWIEPYIKQSGDTPEVMIAIPAAVAIGIVKSVGLIMRTARGVRLVDLGIPPLVILDANGNVSNARIDYIPDCLYINVEHGIKWAEAGGLADQSVVNPPLEHPDWTTYLGRHHGVNVQLVTLSALKPGELIQFRSPNHAVDVTADRNGRALVPVLLPVANDPGPASLIRVNRQSIAGHFTVRAAIFVDQASLPAGRQHRFASSVDGTAVLTTEFDDHIDVHEIGPLGAPILLKRETACIQEYRGGVAQTVPSNEEVALNPQPLPPQEVVTSACNPLLAQSINLPGIISLVAVPGFPGAPIGVATLADGSMLVLDFGEDGTARVAGTFAGPIGVLDVSGDWAIATDPDRISIYRVTREAEQCACEDNSYSLSDKTSASALLVAL